MYLITFSKRAHKDKKLLKRSNLDSKAKEILNELEIDPFVPPRENLVGNLKGYISKRINIQHRIVYKVEDNYVDAVDENGKLYDGIVYVKSMWTHYE